MQPKKVQQLALAMQVIGSPEQLIANAAALGHRPTLCVAHWAAAVVAAASAAAAPRTVPTLAQAIENLSEVTPASCAGYAAMGKPPQTVAAILGSVCLHVCSIQRILQRMALPCEQICVLLNEKPTWRSAVALAQSDDFVPRLVDLRPTDVAEQQAKVCLQLIGSPTNIVQAAAKLDDVTTERLADWLAALLSSKA